LLKELQEYEEAAGDKDDRDIKNKSKMLNFMDDYY
jgi:hypothetical protein